MGRGQSRRSSISTVKSWRAAKMGVSQRRTGSAFRSPRVLPTMTCSLSMVYLVVDESICLYQHIYMSSEPEQLGWLVKRLQHRHHRVLDENLTPLGVSLVQWNALREIDRNPGAP